MESEREQIVWWLRDQADQLYKMAVEHGRSQQFEAAYVVYIAGKQNDKIANLIENGAHLKEMAGE